ncbi:hypothetical protein TSUD_187850 [Trifolium subterraneum]|uniref:CCHC-type domain-containing protein n=1 Tax=Trifolium subterraneum TaxID=3900 RepID=A0A2Z6P8K5_TRISU|nr:hypothetical protein TSUD_187850 [Trifolium subterraneum]
MEAYLDASDLWEAVEDEYVIDPLPDNPTLAQIKNHKVKKQRKSKAKSYLFSAVSEEIFTRIMTLKSAKEIWDFLKQEYEGNEKIKGMQVLNLIIEFEMQRMKESETIKEYSDKLLSIVNTVRLLGTEFSDTRIVQKILVTIPERFESTISSLENSKDLSNITLSELVYALQAQEQRRLMREEGTIEGVLRAKLKLNQGHKGENKNAQWNNFQKGESSNKWSSKAEDEKTNNPLCQHCGKTNHPHFRCWHRPNFRCNKCNQPGHIAKFCKNEEQPKVEAQVANQNEEDEYLFAATFQKRGIGIEKKKIPIMRKNAGIVARAERIVGWLVVGSRENECVREKEIHLEPRVQDREASTNRDRERGRLRVREIRVRVAEREMMKFAYTL